MLLKRLLNSISLSHSFFLPCLSAQRADSFSYIKRSSSFIPFVLITALLCCCLLAYFLCEFLVRSCVCTFACTIMTTTMCGGGDDSKTLLFFALEL